jgi:leucyl aminopeptidase
MITCTISDKSVRVQKAHAYGFVVQEGELLAGGIQEVLAWYPTIADLMKARGFTAKKQQTLVVPIMVEGQHRDLIFVGVGPAKKGVMDIEDYRRAIGSMIRQASSLRTPSIAIVLPHGLLFGVSEAELLTQTIIIANMTTFHFNILLTDKESSESTLKEIVVCGDAVGAIHDPMTVVHDAEIIATAVNKARWWVDTPPSMLTPPDLAKKAEEIAKKQGLAITVFGEQEIIDMGMGGLAGVSKGSDVEARLVIMEYKTDVKDAPTIAFVGKGITFDSGGLSLKPPRHMETMKEDMSGAAAVIASMEALAQLKPAVNIVAITPLSENLPSGKATKPGDVVTFYNGKTAEVKNTDAEGRLVLADALSYAVRHYKPDAIIDLATLTGACAHALGPFHCGMMSEHDDFVRQVEAAARRSGDRVWRLPLHEDYKAAIKSTIADICNIGNEKVMAGAITAAHFLQHFVGDTPWVHLDIAGTAFDVPDISYFRPGATGFGVRLLIDLAMHWNEENKK